MILSRHDNEEIFSYNCYLPQIPWVNVFGAKFETENRWNMMAGFLQEQF